MSIHRTVKIGAYLRLKTDLNIFNLFEDKEEFEDSFFEVPNDSDSVGFEKGYTYLIGNKSDNDNKCDKEINESEIFDLGYYFDFKEDFATLYNAEILYLMGRLGFGNVEIKLGIISYMA